MRTFRIMLVAVLVSAATLAGLGAPAGAAGSVRVSGVGTPSLGLSEACNDSPYADTSADVHYVIDMAGDLEGCIYGSVTSFRFNEGSGTYLEIADETFVGTYGDNEGTFELTELFTGKFDAEGNQIWGRCKHPIVRGSGTGDFAGVTGRLDFKDDVSTGTADYKGSIKLAS